MVLRRCGKWEGIIRRASPLRRARERHKTAKPTPIWRRAFHLPPEKVRRWPSARMLDELMADIGEPPAVAAARSPNWWSCSARATTSGARNARAARCHPHAGHRLTRPCKVIAGRSEQRLARHAATAAGGQRDDRRVSAAGGRRHAGRRARQGLARRQLEESWATLPSTRANPASGAYDLPRIFRQALDSRLHRWRGRIRWLRLSGRAITRTRRTTSARDATPDTRRKPCAACLAARPSTLVSPRGLTGSAEDGLAAPASSNRRR